jgi:hypothetical protein
MNTDEFCPQNTWPQTGGYIKCFLKRGTQNPWIEQINIYKVTSLHFYCDFMLTKFSVLQFYVAIILSTNPQLENNFSRYH